MVDSLLVRCPFGCEWTGRREVVDRHFEDCQSLLCNCPLACGRQIPRSQLSEHETVCRNRPQVCNCGTSMPSHDLTRHLLTCPALWDTVCESPSVDPFIRAAFISLREFVEHQKKENQLLLQTQIKANQKITLLERQLKEVDEARQKDLLQLQLYISAQLESLRLELSLDSKTAKHTNGQIPMIPSTLINLNTDLSTSPKATSMTGLEKQPIKEQATDDSVPVADSKPATSKDMQAGTDTLPKKLKCIHCRKQYNPRTNQSDSCTYHPGALYGDDYYVEWACCGGDKNSKGCEFTFHQCR